MITAIQNGSVASLPGGLARARRRRGDQALEESRLESVFLQDEEREIQMRGRDAARALDAGGARIGCLASRLVGARRACSRFEIEQVVLDLEAHPQLAPRRVERVD